MPEKDQLLSHRLENNLELEMRRGPKIKQLTEEEIKSRKAIATEKKNIYEAILSSTPERNIAIQNRS